MTCYRMKASLAMLVVFMPTALNPAPFVEGSLDTTMDNEDFPLIFLCGGDFGEVMKTFEYDRLVDEGIITFGDLPLPSVNLDTGVPTRGEA